LIFPVFIGWGVVLIEAILQTTLDLAEFFSSSKVQVLGSMLLSLRSLSVLKLLTVLVFGSEFAQFVTFFSGEILVVKFRGRSTHGRRLKSLFCSLFLLKLLLLLGLLRKNLLKHYVFPTKFLYFLLQRTDFCLVQIGYLNLLQKLLSLHSELLSEAFGHAFLLVYLNHLIKVFTRNESWS